MRQGSIQIAWFVGKIFHSEFSGFDKNHKVNGNLLFEYFIFEYHTRNSTSHLEKQNEIRVRNRDLNIDSRASLVMNKRKYLWIILFQFYV